MATFFWQIQAGVNLYQFAEILDVQPFINGIPIFSGLKAVNSFFP